MRRYIGDAREIWGRYRLVLIDSREARAERNAGVLALGLGLGAGVGVGLEVGVGVANPIPNRNPSPDPSPHLRREHGGFRGAREGSLP